MTIRQYCLRILLLTLCVSTLPTTLYGDPTDLSGAPATSSSGFLPLVFVRNKLTLPHTTISLTVDAQEEPAIHERFQKSFDDPSQLVFVREGSVYADPWYGVMGTVEEYNLVAGTTSLYEYTIALDALARIPSPQANLVQETDGEYYLRTVRLSSMPSMWQSQQAITLIIQKIIYPNLPRAFRTVAFRHELGQKENLNELTQTLTEKLDMKLPDSQVISLLRNQESGSLEAFVQVLLTQLRKLQTAEDSSLDAIMNDTEANEDVSEEDEEERVSPGTEEEVQYFRMRAEKLTLPRMAKQELDNALDQYEIDYQNPSNSGNLRKYIKFFLELPWNKETEDEHDLPTVERVLNESHYGLDDVKEKIIDFLSVKACNPDAETNIICLVGPPGVGKTSISAAVAKALGRKFARIALGGVHTEAAIRGHSRTYIGARHGKILQAIHRAGSLNPVIDLDEIDKLATQNGQGGDPSAALLEVLDPEQNKLFEDDYLGTPFDLSKVLFITTANDESTIPHALHDRMEIIRLPGYLQEEKVQIAKRHLIPKRIANAGLSATPLAFSDEVINAVIEQYTYEAGVRNLTQKIKTLVAKYAHKFLHGESITFTPENLREYLRAGFRTKQVSNKPGIGVANGMYYTPMGGGLLYIETNLPKRSLSGEVSSQLQLTGCLKKVMRESAQIALTYIKVNAEKWGIDEKRFNEYNIHVHVPSGATPKDGPSAGIALTASMLSALTDRPIDGRYAMTGEINLRGEVTAIGGVKEKILGTYRTGIRKIILPEENREHFEDIKNVPDDLEIFFVSELHEALSLLLM